MISLDIQDVTADYPAFRVAFAVIGGMAAPTDCGPGIEHLAATAEAEALEILQDQEVAEHIEIQQWRGAYRQFGIKKTSYRNACEALLRRIKRGDGLPRVLPLVDLYNALSIKYRIPVGADDVAALSPPLAFRHSRPGDGFRDLAGDPDSDDPPKPGEVVLADGAHVLCRRWNWRQDARSRILPTTRDATVVLQTLADDGTERLTNAAEELAKHARDDLGATCTWAIASTDTPVVQIQV
jgi:DNA/RNA-binding domain of Phe-tRNA-synthetase-like protein